MNNTLRNPRTHKQWKETIKTAQEVKMEIKTKTKMEGIVEKKNLGI